MELIYVVVPVYKVEPYIHRCIDSILNQTYQNFKLVLVDDGSPDNCPVICNEYAKLDSRIHVIHQENGGLSAARNAGIKYAMKNGSSELDWITFIDSDDFVHPCYLEYLYRATTETGAEFSCCGFIQTTETTIDPVELSEPDPEYLPAEDFWCKKNGEAHTAWGKLYRLFLFGDILYPVGKINEDTFTTYKLVFLCDRIAFIPTKLYYYYQSETSIMRSPWTLRRLDALEALREQKSFFYSHGYVNAYKVACFFFLKMCIFNLRAMEINHYSKTAQKALKKELYAELFAYAKEFGFSEAFYIWFSQRIMHRIKKVINRNFFKRAAAKIKRLLKR